MRWSHIHLAQPRGCSHHHLHGHWCTLMRGASVIVRPTNHNYLIQLDYPEVDINDTHLDTHTWFLDTWMFQGRGQWKLLNGPTHHRTACPDKWSGHYQSLTSVMDSRQYPLNHVDTLQCLVYQRRLHKSSVPQFGHIARKWCQSHTQAENLPHLQNTSECSKT